MPETQVRDVAGRRYALAIRELARGDNSFDRWAAALDGLESLTQTPQFVAVLQSDGMTDERFQQIVRQVVPEIRPARSEERRVGKECRSRGWRCQEKIHRTTR